VEHGTKRVRAPRWRDRFSRRALLRRGSLVAVALATVPATLAAALIADGDTASVAHRVSVAGVAVGGASREEARRRLDAAVSAYLARALDVRAAAATGEPIGWSVVPADLGLAFDLAAAVSAALASGDERGPLDRLAGIVSGINLPLPVALDATRRDAQLWAWAPAATLAPANATFIPTAQDGLAITPDRPGLGIDPDASRAAFLAHAARLASGPVRLAQVPVQAGITATMLAGIADEVAAAIGQPLTLRLGERTWGLNTERLRAALRTRLAGARPVLALDPAALRTLFDRINREAGEAGEDARLVLGADGRYTIMPGRPGMVLDEGATLAGSEAALGAGRHEAAVAFQPQSSTVTAAELAPAYAQLDAILNTPLLVTFAEFARTFGRAELAPLLIVTARSDRPERLAFSLDRAGLLGLAGQLAEALDQGVRDAALRWVDGRVQDVVSSREGRAVDVGATADVLGTALLGATGRATPVVAVVAPASASADKAAMDIADRLGDARSDYSFSIPSRRHNVELATERLDGTLIPPGGLFSFNAAVGPQTIGNGYRAAYGIALVGGAGPGTGQVATVSSVAGGICQVSTMLFQAAYCAGLPIEERNWHLYWIPGYGPPGSPTGLQGLDATVDDQSGLDFRFRNTTGGWLAVEAVADGSTVRLAIYGRDSGWKVAVADPVIGNPRPANPAPVREKTHDLPPGEELAVEHAVDGFDAVNRVRVTDRAGVLVREAAFLSTYYPSRNVVQVGVPTDEALP